MSKYSKINFVYFMQKWMDSVPGQTFLNYAYSWGAAVVILGTLFKLTHLPGANVMLFIGMGTEVFVFFISAFDRPFDKSTIDMTLDNHMTDDVSPEMVPDAVQNAAPVVNGGTPIVGGNIVGGSAVAVDTPVAGGGVIGGGTIIIGGGSNMPQTDAIPSDTPAKTVASAAETPAGDAPITFDAPRVVTPAPAVSQETAEAMEEATSSYVDHLNELNEMLEKVAAQSARLATDSEEMENLNRTLTGIARVYEMQLKSASQQITTQDEINAQTRKMAEQIQELNKVYTRMIEAMTVNMPKVG